MAGNDTSCDTKMGESRGSTPPPPDENIGKAPRLIQSQKTKDARRGPSSRHVYFRRLCRLAGMSETGSRERGGQEG